MTLAEMLELRPANTEAVAEEYARLTALLDDE
jgi:hypothetical protein